MPELLVAWIVLALGLAAAWAIIRAAYSRGFEDGRREERAQLLDALGEIKPGWELSISRERGMETPDA